MTYPRRDQKSNLVPELSDWLAGHREADRLDEQGMIIDRSQASLLKLGRAVTEAEPPMTPERRAELLTLAAQIEARNQAIRRHLETAPERVHGARHSEQGLDAGLGVEHPGHVAREVQGTRDRKMTIENFLAEEMDREQFPDD